MSVDTLIEKLEDIKSICVRQDWFDAMDQAITIIRQRFIETGSEQPPAGDESGYWQRHLFSEDGKEVL